MKRRPRAHQYRIIVIGGSAGALEALQRVLKGFTSTLPAAIFVVIHTSAGSARLLASILERTAKLPPDYPQDGEAIVAGRVYVAPPDHHLLIEPGLVRTTKGPPGKRLSSGGRSVVPHRRRGVRPARDRHHPVGRAE